MPAAINPADRRLLLIAGGAFLLLLCAVAFLTPAGGEDAGVVPSTYSSGPGGARAAFLLLQQMGLPVERWENSPVDLPAEGSGAVLILANPVDKPNQAEHGALMRFVQTGGRVLVTGIITDDFFPPAYLLPQPTRTKPQTFDAIVPSAFTRHAERIELSPLALWGTLDDTQVPLYGDPRHPVVTSWKIGRGRILWWAGATPLTNARISDAENLNLLLDAVGLGGDSADPPTRIYWDEYFHGERGSLWGYVSNTPVAWGLAQLGLLCVAVLLTFGRSSGPLVPAARASRLWPLEFVDTLGALYQRADATPAAVGIVYRNFRVAMTRRLRLPSDISDAALGQALGNSLGWHGHEMAQTLARAGAASRGEKLSPNEALQLVQDLDYCRQQLDSKTPHAKWRP
jgi:uncharacterized protein DUF4350